MYSKLRPGLAPFLLVVDRRRQGRKGLLPLSQLVLEKELCVYKTLSIFEKKIWVGIYKSYHLGCPSGTSVAFQESP